MSDCVEMIVPKLNVLVNNSSSLHKSPLRHIRIYDIGLYK